MLFRMPSQKKAFSEGVSSYCSSNKNIGTTTTYRLQEKKKKMPCSPPCHYLQKYMKLQPHLSYCSKVFCNANTFALILSWLKKVSSREMMSLDGYNFNSFITDTLRGVCAKIVADLLAYCNGVFFTSFVQETSPYITKQQSLFTCACVCKKSV